MRNRVTVGASLAVALLACSALGAGDAIGAGPKVGSDDLPVFHPLNVTGSQAGKRACQVWLNGGNPVVAIFAREISDSLTSLVKKVDEATVKNKSARMGSFVVFCKDSEELEKKLQAFARKQDLKKIVLAIDNPAGPEGWHIAKDADITVILYVNKTVKANRAFKRGKLKTKDIDAIVADVSKILPSKK